MAHELLTIGIIGNVLRRLNDSLANFISSHCDSDTHHQQQQQQQCDSTNTPVYFSLNLMKTSFVNHTVKRIFGS